MPLLRIIVGLPLAVIALCGTPARPRPTRQVHGHDNAGGSVAVEPERRRPRPVRSARRKVTSITPRRRRRRHGATTGR